MRQTICEKGGGIGALLWLWAAAMAGPSAADSWLPPTVTTYVSPDGAARITISPRQIRDQLAYFEDKVEGREPAGQPPGSHAGARGKLERRIGGRWTAVWDRALVNEVAPASALVSNGGDHVVTFDNWHSAGHGDHVVVIYGPAGALVRSFALTDILPESYVDALPMTTSSLWWGGEHLISGGDLVLKVVVPGGEEDEARRYVDVRIDLVSGTVRPPSGPAWDAALAGVAKETAKRSAARAEWVAEMKRPLAGPAGSDQFDWLRYMYEAFRRVAPDWKENPPQAIVLASPRDADYADDLEMFVGLLEEGETENGGTNFIVASSDEANMAAVLVGAAPRLATGKLKGKRLYLVVSDAQWPALRTALDPTGAELVQIDPTKPIPQRPERMPN